MSWTTLLSLGDLKEDFLTEEAKEKIREHPLSSRHPVQSLLSLTDIKEEYLTDRAKKWIRKNNEDRLEHPLWNGYGYLVPIFVAGGIGCMLAFVFVLLFGGK